MLSLFSSQFRKQRKLSRPKGKRSRTGERQKKSKLDRYVANKERILKMIAPNKRPNTSGDKEEIATESLADEDRIAPNNLNLEEISNLRKFDASYVIGMLKEGLFSEAGKQILFENLPFTLASDGDTSGDTYNELNESDGKGNGDSEDNRSDSQSEGEGIDLIARVKAKVLMTV